MCNNGFLVVRWWISEIKDEILSCYNMVFYGYIDN